MVRIANYRSTPREQWPKTEAEFRAAVVGEAECWVGVKGRTPECDLLFEDAAPCYPKKSKSGKHWCGIGALHCLRAALLTKAVWRDVVGFIGSVLGWASLTRDPKPGDIKYHDNRSRHHGVVVAADDKWVYTIDFNAGLWPGKVKRAQKRRGAKKVYYYSIGGLIAKALAREAVDTDPAPPPETGWDPEDTAP
jgi:hypothetical protein